MPKSVIHLVTVPSTTIIGWISLITVIIHPNNLLNWGFLITTNGILIVVQLTILQEHQSWILKQKCIFSGCSSSHYGYISWCKTWLQLPIRHVVFYETSFPFPDPGSISALHLKVLPPLSPFIYAIVTMFTHTYSLHQPNSSSSHFTQTHNTLT